MQTYNFDYSQYKKKLNKKNPLAIPILIILILILLIIAMFVKPKNLGKIEFYFVEINSFSTYADASILAQELQEKGGAGYILFDGAYRVLASYYSTKKDAETVINNIKNEYLTARIYTLSTIKKFKSNKLNSKLTDCITSISNLCLKSIDNISNLIISHDKNEIQTSALKLELKKISSDFEDPYNNFINLSKNNSKLNVSKEYLLTLSSNFSQLKEFESSENSNSALKYNLIKLITTYCLFIESF